MADERMVSAILKAISGNESGGDYGVWNKQGEPSYAKYQFLPDTWKRWVSMGVSESGQKIDPSKVPMTPENQEAVARYKVSSLLDDGYSPDQVLSIWNSGKPDYKGKAGVNRFGNKYDVQGYVQKGMKVLGQLMGPSEAEAAEIPKAKPSMDYSKVLFREDEQSTPVATPAPTQPAKPSMDYSKALFGDDTTIQTKPNTGPPLPARNPEMSFADRVNLERYRDPKFKVKMIGKSLFPDLPEQVATSRVGIIDGNYHFLDDDGVIKPVDKNVLDKVE